MATIIRYWQISEAISTARKKWMSFIATRKSGLIKRCATSPIWGTFHRIAPFRNMLIISGISNRFGCNKKPLPAGRGFFSCNATLPVGKGFFSCDAALPVGEVSSLAMPLSRWGEADSVTTPATVPFYDDALTIAPRVTALPHSATCRVWCDARSRRPDV